MKKKMMLGSIGAVAIALLMVSSANAVTTPQLKESSNSGNGVTNYVEPGIHISVAQKRILKAALPYVDDPNFHVLLQKIIEKRGSVDSNDIEQILIDNNLEVGTIAFGSIVTGAGSNPSSGGMAHCLRRFFCMLMVVLPVALLHFYTCYQEAAFPNTPDCPPQITIGGTFIDYSIVGNAIGFWGLVFNNMAPYVGWRCDGNAILIQYRDKLI